MLGQGSCFAASTFRAVREAGSGTGSAGLGLVTGRNGDKYMRCSQSQAIIKMAILCLFQSASRVRTSVVRRGGLFGWRQMHGAESKLRHRRESFVTGNKTKTMVKSRAMIICLLVLGCFTGKGNEANGQAKDGTKKTRSKCLDFALDGAVDEDRSGTRGCLR